MKRRVLVSLAAIVLVLIGWTARGWAYAKPVEHLVTFDWRSHRVAATCADGCKSSTQYDRAHSGDEEIFQLTYHCDDRPCVVKVSGRGELIKFKLNGR
jgi:hypothetical protein